MGLFRYSIAIIIAAIISFPGIARAQCVDPGAEAGNVIFSSSNASMRYCNGADWIDFPRSGEPACGTPGAWEQQETYDLTEIAYGNGLFVATAQDDVIYTSPDGINWATQPVVYANWKSVTYGGGQFVAVANASSSGRVMTSPDGITWTNRTAAENNDWNGVTYGNGRYVAVSYNGTNRVMSSTDGITWTPHAATAAYPWDGVAYGNGRFVAVAEVEATDNVMTSTDGMNWTTVTKPSTVRLRDIIYAGGQFVAINDHNNTAATSPTGSTGRSTRACRGGIGVTLPMAAAGIWPRHIWVQTRS